MITEIQKQYDYECPDCFIAIDDEVEHEMACENCGHVFLDVNQIDESCFYEDA